MTDTEFRLLRESLDLYKAEMATCRNSQPPACWALLHLVLVIPAICAAVQEPDGRTDGKATDGTRRDGKAYRDWCTTHIASKLPTPAERYQMRCKILHQAHAGDFVFVPPGSNSHLTQVSNLLYVDVGVLHDQVVEALEHWFAFLTEHPNGSEARNVAAHVKKMVRVQGETRFLKTPTFTLVSLPPGIKEKLTTSSG